MKPIILRDAKKVGNGYEAKIKFTLNDARISELEESFRQLRTIPVIIENQKFNAVIRGTETVILPPTTAGDHYYEATLETTGPPIERQPECKFCQSENVESANIVAPARGPKKLTVCNDCGRCQMEEWT